jgi:hypothetical protein
MATTSDAPSAIAPSRYLDRFVRSAVGSRLAALRVFPDAKEVTESFAARAAVLRFRKAFRPDDPDVVLIAVGDGSTPRTAATFAWQSAWRCHSVDPRLRASSRWDRVPRLVVHPRRIEDCWFSARQVVVVAVHSHVGLAASLASVTAEEVLLVALPCCVPVDLTERPDLCYDDGHVLSAQRTIYVWHYSSSSALQATRDRAPRSDGARTPPPSPRPGIPRPGAHPRDSRGPANACTPARGLRR